MYFFLKREQNQRLMIFRFEEIILLEKDQNWIKL
jgi:hypothetical protein